MKTLLAILSVILIILNATGQVTYTVTKTTDPDPFIHPYHFVDSLCDPDMYGTYQWAVRKGNDTPGPFIIQFALPGSGPHTIYLDFEPPVLSNSNTIIVDGTSQTGYTFGHPAIVFDGNEIISTCFSSYFSNNVTFKGIQIQNFNTFGVYISDCNSGLIENNVIVSGMSFGIVIYESYSINVKGNYIGTDFNLNSGMGCANEGIRISNYSGSIIGNHVIGGININEGNTIAYNGSYGITVLYSINNLISGNRIFNNSSGAIHLYGQGANLKQPPVITSYSGTIVTGTSAPNDIIEIFGSTGNENANEYLATVIADANGDWTANVSTSYDRVVATGTEIIHYNTSALSIYYPNTQIPGSNCESSILIEPSSLYQAFVFGQNDELWLKFFPDTTYGYFLIKNFNNCISNFSIFGGTCESQYLLESSDSLHIETNSLLFGHEYYIKISFFDTCTFSLLYLPNLVNPSCPPVNCASNISNWDFQTFGGWVLTSNNPFSPSSNNPFEPSGVCGWYRAWGTPNIVDIDSDGNYETFLGANIENYVNKGECIRQSLSVITDRIYLFRAKYNASNHYGNSYFGGDLRFYISNSEIFQHEIHGHSIYINHLNTLDLNNRWNQSESISQYGVWRFINGTINTSNFSNNENLYIFPHSTSNNVYLQVKLDYVDIYLPTPSFTVFYNNCGSYSFTDNTIYHDVNIQQKDWYINGVIYPQYHNQEILDIHLANGLNLICLAYYYLDNSGVPISETPCLYCQEINVSYNPITIDVNNEIICNGDNAVLFATVSNGSSNYTYNWSNGTSTNPIIVNPTYTTTYSVTVTDANGCTTSNSTTVVVLPIPEFYFETTDETCLDVCDGSAQVIVNNMVGIGNIWSYNNSTANPITDLCPGEYFVTVTGDNNCTNSGSVEIDANVNVQINSVIATSSCSNQNNGTITVNASAQGGTVGCITYSICGVTNYNGTFEDLLPGNYTVSACCSGCCVTQDIVVPEVDVSVMATPTHITDPCVACDGSISLSINPAGSPGTYSYQWSANISVPAEEYVSDLCSGFYGVTVTDNATGCTFSQYTYIDYQAPAPNSLANNLLPSQYTIINGDYYINGNVVIDNLNVDVERNMCIPNGSSLTITNSTLNFLPSKGIFVLPNSSLDVNNHSVLTSFCDILWRGIYASINDATNPSSISIDNSTIENAYQGIFAQGNITVHSNLSSFFNNWEGIFLRTIPTDYINIIQNNHFETNRFELFPSLPANTNLTYPDFHVIIQRVGALQPMSGNTFQNTFPFVNVSVNTRGGGIKSIHNNNTVTVQNSIFNGLWYGIKNYTSIMNVVNNNYFTLNNRSVYSTGTPSYIIVNGNTFNVSNRGNLYNSATLPYGVCVDNTNSYKIYVNTFKNGFIGTVNRNTGTGSPPVWKNNFQNLYVGSLGNGISDVRFNCNNYFNNSNLYYYNSALGNIAGGDMMVVGNNALVNTNQSYRNNPFGSTMNSVTNNLCGQIIPIAPGVQLTLNFLKFHNRTSTPYTYRSCESNDPTYIQPCAQQPHPAAGAVNNLLDYSYFIDQYPILCYDDYENPAKSLAESFSYTDSLRDVKEYKQNVLNALIDNGQTDYILNYIQNLKPNNFNTLYNILMSASPYLSDEVLIAFMLHPINKPVHKKDVVLANSPLPYKVRPYINQMNINQNFKNQIWAAQAGNPNARVYLEEEIDWTISRRQMEITELAIKCVRDSSGLRQDSLIDFLANSDVLEDRVTRYGLLVNNNYYAEALTELPVITNLTNNLSIEKQMQYDEFKDVSEILISTLLYDSLADSLILVNESFLQSIALTDFHVAQSDAKILLEIAGIEQTFDVTLLDEPEMRSNIMDKQSEKPEDCNMISVSPNPSDGALYVTIIIPDETNDYVLQLISKEGKVVHTWKINNNGEIVINCNTCISGQYTLTMFENENILCSRKVQILR